MTAPRTYRDAGVDIDAGDAATRRIKPLVQRTFNSNVLSEIGLFGGLFDVSSLPEQEPVLVSSTDSVGTKTKTAVACGKFASLGKDIVNHCVNDILVQGARPLFFLDYIAVGKLSPDRIEEIVAGVAEACVENNCALIGGEMCEMPDVYQGEDLDLVGTVIGVVEKKKILDGSKVRAGDGLIGLASSGLHTNGYTLARKALYEEDPSRLQQIPVGWKSALGEALLEPHRCYLKSVQPLLEAGGVHAMAHITGGGIPGNLSRVVPDGLSARVYLDSWELPPLFSLLAEKTGADAKELYRTFNMGIGMILCVEKETGPFLLNSITETGLDAWEIGEVVPDAQDRSKVQLV